MTPKHRKKKKAKAKPDASAGHSARPARDAAEERAALQPAENPPLSATARPAVSWIVLAALFGSIVIFSSARIGNFDIWWHLSVGQRIAQTRSFAGTDDLNHTHPGLAYENECWLFDLASYGLWRAGDGAGLVLARILIFLAAFGVLYAALRRLRTPLPLAAALLYVSALVILHRFFIRNFAVGYVFVALFLFLLTSPRAARRDRSVLLLCPLLMVLWTNIHVGCATGVILAGLYLVSTAIDRARGRCDQSQVMYAALLLGLVVLASGVSPYPFEWVRRMYLNLMVYPASQAMEEIAPPFDRFRLFYLACAAGAVVLAASFRRVSPFVLLAYIFTAFAALKHVRFIGEFGMVFPIAMGHVAAARIGSARVREWIDRRSRIEAAAVALAVLMAAGTAFIATQRMTLGTGPNCKALPCGAVEFIREADLPGPFYNMLGWGGFFTWNLYPQQRAFWDGRFKAQIDLFEAFRERPALEVLDGYGVRFALIPFPSVRRERSDMGLIGIERRLLDDPGNWALVYFDDVAVILARRVPANRAIIDVHAYRTLRPWRLDFAYADTADPGVRAAIDQDLALARSRLPDEPLPMYLAARYRAAVGDLETARKLYEEGAAAHPDSPLFPAGLGVLLTEEERYEAAARQFEKAIAAGAPGGRTLNNLGVAFLRMGDVAKARWRFAQAIDREPTLREPYDNLAEILRMLGDLDEAEKLQRRYEKARQVAETD